eukprot:TRINITY_DN199_c1_g1_i1.p1 TRINITY_DN199_c1_g1~~TRINITY_DN199_c1_g1_i1.p1  ORF type:complete len:101 (+),score=2.66 TRINITY_DN199_c1_g1_i1:4-306(+)
MFIFDWHGCWGRLRLTKYFIISQCSSDLFLVLDTKVSMIGFVPAGDTCNLTASSYVLTLYGVTTPCHTFSNWLSHFPRTHTHARVGTLSVCSYRSLSYNP